MKYFNRYTQTIEEESVPGEGCLRFLYHTKLGFCFLHLFFKRAWISKLAGWWMNQTRSKKKIPVFIKKYNIDVDCFEKKLEDYSHFNDFFYRKFKEGERPIDPNPDQVCFPAEGRHLGFQMIEDMQKFFVKGKSFGLKALLNEEYLSQRYQGGTCVISRLAPTDYHRFHFPCDCIPRKIQLINGFLFSVNPIALKRSFRILNENKRWLTELETEKFGTVTMIEVGACCVGSVQETFMEQIPVKKGDEKGYFLFGGSTVITLFEYGKVVLSRDLLDCTKRGLELYAHVKDVMGFKK